MSKLIESVKEKKISRRTFLKAGALSTATLGLAGCDNELVSTNGSDIDTTNAKWVSAACWNNCGGRCLNKALVADGIVLGQKTDDTREDTYDNPQQRACVRGRAQRFQTFGLDRIKYPMKRKNWEPGGGDKSLRGKDEWERISWDEAIAYVADEITRVKDEYGTEAILSTGAQPLSTLSKLGTVVNDWGSTSWGSWRITPFITGVLEGCFFPTNMNDRMDNRKSERCIAFGINPAWSSLGNATNFFMQMKDAGCEFIIFDPIYTDTISILGAEWVPIRPGTDMAVQLAMAYTLITEDDPDTNALIDWDFLNTYTLGFDSEHMPTDAETDENFKDYVLGAYDDTPKTPEWASEISGVDANKIRQVARKMGKNVKLSLLTGWAPNRTYNTDNAPQLFMTLGAMGGHWGREGQQTGVSSWNYTANFGDRLVNSGSSGSVPAEAYTGETHAYLMLNDTELWPAVLNGEFKETSVLTKCYSTAWAANTASFDLKTPIGTIKNPIKMIWHSQGAQLQTREGQTQGIEAHRAVDFVVCQSHFLTTNAKYSDIVLPVTTKWEDEGVFFPSGVNRDMIIVNQQVTTPQYEAKDDAWITNEIGMALGIPDQTNTVSLNQQKYNMLSSCTVKNAEGTAYEPLVTITDAEIAELGVEGTAQVGHIGMDEFLEQGVYQIERSADDNYGYIAYGDFIKDPVANPLHSKSGKFEIYCQSLSDIFTNYGFGEVPALPKYRPIHNGYEETFTNWETKTKGDYPYQIINPHYQRRSHSILDNIPHLREALVQPVFVSATDAREKGVENGDTILVTSAYGKTLRQAYVTERYMAGVVGLPHGAWVDIDEETGIDMAGSDNILAGAYSGGQGVSGWNSQLVNFEKWDGEAVPRDIDVAQRIIF